MKRLSGFTLIEMMVVLLIIGLLMAVLLMNPFGVLKKAKKTTAKLEMKRLQLALERFRENVGRYPTTDEGLEALVVKPDDIEEDRWEKVWPEKKVPRDPWGRKYIYESDDGATYKLMTLGADGKEGGKGDNADIVCTPDGCE